ncbi:tol-pal system protein YbgF [Roseivirga sp. E12]|uniref:tol-pal system protein YbgF n=1 Tax=Roseivirga sp. E12 TaxID=2819237 RepID=UPI001ABCBE6A|nr:tol-pal system protein YbgF [Roseivirga sp. E12]MBO3699133.1 tol-pal system protein YbgF [Roseivirga sp. E12]
MKRSILYILILFSFCTQHALAQSASNRSEYLLLNMPLQIEITDAVDNMYNFNFHKAEVDFNWLKYRYPEHPLPYFLYGISTWWQMLPNLEAETPLGDEFLAYMDSAIVKAKVLLEQDENNVEAAFFLAGSYGFKGRYHSEKKNWGRAASAGKWALRYLEKTKGNEGFSPEILFGDALFNYYSIWIRENYPMLKPILMFFPKGEKQLGIEQMEQVSKNAFYTRIEAIYFLMRIKAFEEQKTYDALRLGEQIYRKYPNNAYFHRFYAQMLYTTGQYQKAETESLDILKRIEAGQQGYEAVSGRYASFYLGHINKKRNDHKVAQEYFNQVVDFSVSSSSEDSGYHLNAQLYLAQYDNQSANYESALDRISIIRDNTRRREDINKKARALRKEIKRKI